MKSRYLKTTSRPSANCVFRYAIIGTELLLLPRIVKVGGSIVAVDVVVDVVDVVVVVDGAAVDQ